MALNVNRSVQDAFYRYKMPRLMAKVEGKGNGVKTVIPNMVDIARALGRPPTYPTKYFGCELGAQTQFDFKNDRYIVNGSHDAAKLQDMLDGFIKKFVLCENCDNPETVLKANSRKGIIVASCKACGHSFTLDIRHKLTTFILKNPPEQKLNATGSSLSVRQNKKSRRKDGEKGNDDGSNEEDAAFPSANNNEVEDEDDDIWETDVSDAAVKQRMKALTSGIKGLAMDDDVEKSEHVRVNILHDYIKAKLEAAGSKLEASHEKEILTEAERLEVVNKTPIVLCEILFDSAKIVAQIKSYKQLMLRFTAGNQKAQKYLMGGIEKTIETHQEALLPKVPHIFKTLYDEDILDEEVILDWGKKVSKKYVSKELSEQIHKKAEPFLTWLKEAEEESEESDEDDLDLEFDEKAKISTIKEKVEEPATVANGNGKAVAKKEEEDEEDLDIDDI